MAELQLDPQKIPHHIAIIMDGNGRWAKERGENRTYGHSQGVKAVKRTVEAAAEFGVKYLTLYTFSTENWNRPKHEVNLLMKLLVKSLNKEMDSFMENNIRLNTIGNIELLPEKANQKLQKVIEQTSINDGMTLTLALSYGSRDELIQAIKKIADNVKNNIISSEKIDESIINTHLYTHNLPDVDLLIRTSGEHRISNFMLWQIAYAELYFINEYWPDFSKEDLKKAMISYQNRERRFGKTSEQLHE
jgi:undecaprenyl diphosphate synthase